MTTTSDVDATSTKDATVSFQRKPWQKPNGGVFIYIGVMIAAFLANFAPLVRGDVHSFLIGMAFCVPGFLVIIFVLAFGPRVLVKGEVDARGARGTTWWGKSVDAPWDTVTKAVLRVPRNKPNDPAFALVLHMQKGRGCMITIPRTGYPQEVRYAIDAVRQRGVQVANYSAQPI